MLTLYWNRNTNQVYLDRYGRTPATVRALRGEDQVQVILLEGLPTAPVTVPAGDTVGIIVRNAANLKAGCLAGPTGLVAGAAAADGYSGETSSDTTPTRSLMEYDPAVATAELATFLGSAVVYHLPAGATQADESLPFPWTVAANYLRPDQPPADVVAPPLTTGALVTAVEQAAQVPFAYQDYGRAASAAVDSRLLGKSAGNSTVALFAAADYVGGTAFTRNPGLFCADLDWTSFSPWNSTEGPYQGGSAITARHVLLANHFSGPTGGSNPMTAGTTKIAFVDNASVTYQRTVTALTRIGTTDLLIGTLDSDLPASITPDTVLPGGLSDSLLPAGTAALYGNQAKTIHVAEITDFFGSSIAAATTANRAPWTTAGPAVVGDSGSPVSLILNGQRVLWCLFHTATGGGDLPGANVAAINAVLAQAGNYALRVASLTTLPPQVTSQLAADNTFTGTNIFEGSTYVEAIGEGNDGTWQINADGSGSLADGNIIWDANGGTTITKLQVSNGLMLSPSALPASGTPGEFRSDGHHAYCWLDQGTSTYAWKQLD